MGLVLEVGAHFAFCVPVSSRHNDRPNFGGGRYNTSISSPTSAPSVYAAANFSMSGIGISHMSENSSAACYSGEHHSSARGGLRSRAPTSPSGGVDLTTLMQLMVVQRMRCTDNDANASGPSDSPECTLAEARQMKEAECYVRARESKWMPGEGEDFLLQGTARSLSGGGSITLSTERFLVPEALFHADEAFLEIISAASAAAAASEVTKVPAPVAAPAQWSCVACTLINSPARRTCEICGTVAPDMHIAALTAAIALTQPQKPKVAKQFRSLVELVEIALSRVNLPAREVAPVLYCIGGGLAFRDLSRRLQHDINYTDRKRVSSVVFVGKHAAWSSAAKAGVGSTDDWISSIAWPSPAADQIVSRMRRKM